MTPVQENVKKLLSDPSVNPTILKIYQNMMELKSRVQNSEINDEISEKIFRPQERESFNRSMLKVRLSIEHIVKLIGQHERVVHSWNENLIAERKQASDMCQSSTICFGEFFGINSRAS